MKTLVALVGLLLASALPSHAVQTGPKTYVYQVRVTPGTSPSRVLAFQNTSAGEDVLIRRIDIVNATTMTVTGGQEGFWVYTSTQVTHSSATGSGFSYLTASTAPQSALPSYISASTAPLNVQFEGDSAPVTSSASLAGVSPILSPMFVDGDDAATVNRSASWSAEDQSAREPAAPFVLPAGKNRALVVEKRQAAGTDFIAGAYYLRILFTVR